MKREEQHIWSVVLAGGEGSRMRTWLRAKLGTSLPKQFCFLQGDRSMLQMTLDRARLIAPGGNVMAVTLKAFEQIATTQIDGRHVDLLVQPENRGTTNAIYLALSHIMARDPDACVALFPSDHHVEPEPAFVQSIRCAMEASTLLPERLLLIGATPDRKDSDYGWVMPGDSVAYHQGSWLSSVAAFREKPHSDDIPDLYQAGGLWSTFIIIGKARTFIDIGGCFSAEMRVYADQYQSITQRWDDEEVRVSFSESFPVSDFSKDILQQVPDRLALFHLTGVYWNDWGKPERVMRDLGRKHCFSGSPGFSHETVPAYPYP